MGLPERESRPADNGTATDISTAIKSNSILPPTTLHHPKAIAPAYAVLLMRRDGQWRRQIYLSLHSATKALERAEANGREAKMQLVELVPVLSMPIVIVQGGAA